MRSRPMARYVLTGLALAMLGLLPPAGQTDDGLLSLSKKADGQLSPLEKADKPLRFRLQEGDLFAYQMKMNMEMTFDSSGQGATTAQEMTMVIEQRVVEVEPETGYGIVQSAVKTMDATMSMKDLPPDMTQEQADAIIKQSEAVMNQMTKPMLNKPYKITMTPRGEIKKIDAEGLMEAVKAMAAVLGPEASAPFVDMFSEETLKKNSAAAGMVYPKEDEAKWTQEGEISMGPVGELSFKTVWERQEDETVLKIPSHKLALSGTGKMADPNASRQINGVTFAANLSEFKMEGTVHVSQEDGWPVKTAMSTSVVMSMAVEEVCSVESVSVSAKQTMTAERLTPEKYKQLIGSGEGNNAVEPLTPAEKVDGPLRFRLQEGDLFAYRDKQKIEITRSSPGGAGTMTVKYEVDLVIEQRVVEVAENRNGIIETKYKELDVAVGVGGTALSGVPQEEIDKALEEANRALTEMVKPILNEPYKVTMTPRGEIKKVDAKEFLAAIESIEVPADMPPFTPKDWFTEESLKINPIVPGLVFPKLEDYIWKSEMKAVEKMEGISLMTTDVEIDWSRQGDKIVKKIPSHILEFTGSGKQSQDVESPVNLESYDIEGTVHVSKEDLWPVKTKIVKNMVVTATDGQRTATGQMKQTSTSERLRPDEY